MTHDSEYCRSRAAQALAIASHKGDSEATRIAGDLALAYTTLAKHRRAAEARERRSADPQIIELHEQA